MENVTVKLLQQYCCCSSVGTEACVGVRSKSGLEKKYSV